MRRVGFTPLFLIDRQKHRCRDKPDLGLRKRLEIDPVGDFSEAGAAAQGRIRHMSEAHQVQPLPASVQQAGIASAPSRGKVASAIGASEPPNGRRPEALRAFIRAGGRIERSLQCY